MKHCIWKGSLYRDLHQQCLEWGDRPVDVNSLEVKPDSEKISIPSKRKGKLGQPRETYFVPKPATVNIKTSEIPPVLLAAAFMAWRARSTREQGHLPMWR